MVVLITVFTLCNLPDAASHLSKAFASDEVLGSTAAAIANDISNFFHFNNAAWNFFIYLGFNAKFRQTLKDLFTAKKSVDDKIVPIKTLSSEVQQGTTSTIDPDSENLNRSMSCITRM